MKAIALVIALTTSSAAAQSTFVTIGDLPGGFHTSHTSGISADGRVLTGLSSSSSGLLAYRWTADTGITALPTLPGTQGYQGGAVSPNGTYISGAHGVINLSAYYGFVWSEQTGMVSVGSLPGGRDVTRLGYITDDGVVVGMSDFDLTSTGVSLFRATKWTPQGGLEAIPLPDPTDLQHQSSALFVLDDGRVFGSSNSGRWLYSEDSGFEMIPVGSYMRRISRSGDFMIGTMLDSTSPIPHRARYWTPDTGEVSLAPYGDDYASEALYMSDDGSIIIGRGTLGWQVWLDQGAPILFEDLIANYGIELGDWRIESINGISEDGRTIFGNAINLSSGEVLIEGFLIKIPAPMTIAPFVALGLVATRGRRSGKR